MQRAFVISPFGGRPAGQPSAAGADADRIVANVEALRWLCRQLTLRGYAVFAGHGFYTSFMDDAAPAERALGIAAGHAWLDMAELAVVYKFGGVLSDGMVLDIARARARGIQLLEVVEGARIDEFELRPYVD